MSYRISCLVANCVLFTSLASVAVAQPVGASGPNNGATVSADGSALLQVQPTEMLMRVDLVARGKTLKEALGKLTKRREAANLLLKDLAAQMDSIKFDAPSSSAGGSGQMQQQMQQMIAQQLRSVGGELPAGLKAPQTTTVTQPLTARWKLSGTEPVALLEEIAALKKKIEGVDISGAKDKSGLSAEELELLEEGGSPSMNPYSGEMETPPGTPHFAFLATITDQQRRDALREAFQKAEQAAQDLAAAAGMELAGLSTLTSGPAVGSPYDESYAYMAYRRSQMNPLLAMGLDSKNTSFSEDLSPVKFNFSLSVTFHVNKASK